MINIQDTKNAIRNLLEHDDYNNSEFKEYLKDIELDEYIQLENELKLIDGNKEYNLFITHIDRDKIAEFEKQIAEKKKEIFTKEELLELYQNAENSKKNIELIEKIENRNIELKDNLLNAIKKEEEILKYKKPILEGIENFTITDDVDTKTKLFALEYNQKLYNSYKEHITSINNGIDALLNKKDEIEKEDLLALKDSFYKRRDKNSKIDAFSYLKEEDKKNVNEIFKEILSKNVNEDTSKILNNLKDIVQNNQNNIVEISKDLNLTNIEIKEQIKTSNVDVDLKLKSWQQNKEGKWESIEIDLLKEVDATNLKALNDKIEEIHKGNKAYINRFNNDGINNLRRQFDDTFGANGSDKSFNFLNYGVFPYTLFLDLSEAGNNIFSFGKNLANDYSQNKEKSEIIKSVSESLKGFEPKVLENSLSDKNKEILNNLKVKSKEENKDLEQVVKDYYNNKLKVDLKDSGLKNLDVTKEVDFLTNSLMSFENFKILSNANLNYSEELEKELKYQIDNLTKMEKQSISNVSDTMKNDYLKFGQSYSLLLKEELKSLNESLKSENENLNELLSKSSNEEIKELSKTIEKNNKNLKNCNELIKVFEEKEKSFINKIDSVYKQNEVVDQLLSTKANFNIKNVEDFKTINEIDSSGNYKELNKDLIKNIGIKNEKLKKNITEVINPEEIKTLTEESNKKLPQDQQVSELDVASRKLELIIKSNNPLSKKVSEILKDSLNSYKETNVKNGTNPSIQGFINNYQIFTPIDFTEEFQNLFENFVDNYDELKLASKELNLDPLNIFTNISSERVTTLKNQISEIENRINDFKIGDKNIPIELKALIKDKEKFEKFQIDSINKTQSYLEKEEERRINGINLDKKLKDKKDLEKEQKDLKEIEEKRKEQDKQIREDEEKFDDFNR